MIIIGYIGYVDFFFFFIVACLILYIKSVPWETLSNTVFNYYFRLSSFLYFFKLPSNLMFLIRTIILFETTVVAVIKLFKNKDKKLKTQRK